MGQANRAVVESVAGDLLAELGYEVEVSHDRFRRSRGPAIDGEPGPDRAFKQRFRELSLRDSLLIARAGVRSRLRSVRRRAVAPANSRSQPALGT